MKYKIRSRKKFPITTVDPNVPEKYGATIEQSERKKKRKDICQFIT